MMHEINAPRVTTQHLHSAADTHISRGSCICEQGSDMLSQTKNGIHTRACTWTLESSYTNFKCAGHTSTSSTS
eukprot:1682257-Pleurochrysis_carterae.AAC.1